MLCWGEREFARRVNASGCRRSLRRWTTRRGRRRFRPMTRRWWPWPGTTGCRRCFRSPAASSLPAQLAEAFRRDRVVTAARNMILGQVAEECLRALAAAGIPTIVLKGLDYETRLYGAPGARPTADVDLLVPDEKRRAAFARARSPRLRATRRRARVRRRRLPRGRLDTGGRRDRPAHGAGAFGPLPDRLPGHLARRRSRFGWADPTAWPWPVPTPPSSTRCTWRSITSTSRRSTSSIWRGCCPGAETDRPRARIGARLAMRTAPRSPRRRWWRPFFLVGAERRLPRRFRADAGADRDALRDHDEPPEARAAGAKAGALRQPRGRRSLHPQAVRTEISRTDRATDAPSIGSPTIEPLQPSAAQLGEPRLRRSGKDSVARSSLLGRVGHWRVSETGA